MEFSKIGCFQIENIQFSYHTEFHFSNLDFSGSSRNTRLNKKPNERRFLLVHQEIS
jgi:hypothetical protein